MTHLWAWLWCTNQPTNPEPQAPLSNSHTPCQHSSCPKSPWARYRQPGTTAIAQSCLNYLNYPILSFLSVSTLSCPFFHIKAPTWALGLGFFSFCLLPHLGTSPHGPVRCTVPPVSRGLRLETSSFTTIVCPHILPHLVRTKPKCVSFRCIAKWFSFMYIIHLLFYIYIYTYIYIHVCIYLYVYNY